VIGPVLTFSLLVILVPVSASAAETASCEAKQGWRHRIVRSAVHRWFRSDPRPDDLLHLIQAEQGIVACTIGDARPLRLHTMTLPRGLQVDQLGAVLLANELEWSGLVPRPEEGLAGEWFPVKPTPPDRGAGE
jgi:hypothetical protein